MTALTWAVGALVAVSAADIATTRAGLRTGRAYERNPLMVWWTRTLWRAICAKCLGLAIAISQLAVVAPTHPRLALACAWLGVVLTGRIAYGNYRVLQAIRRDIGSGCGNVVNVRDSPLMSAERLRR